MIYDSWDMEHDRENLFSFWTIFCPFTPPLPPYNPEPRESEFWKNEKKNNWKYHHFTQVYHKWQPYDTWFLKYEVHQTEFFCNFLFWAMFCLVTLLTAQKIKISKKGKKHLEISPFYTCVPKIMIRWFMVHEIWYVTDR